MNRQALLDRAMALQYRPSPAMAAIVERTELSDDGEMLFYASQPQLLGRDAFNDACRSVAHEHTAVLGCYARSTIFLFDISDQRLDGIREVTAAHELLHAGYQRLSKSEKARIDQLLEQQSFGADEARINDLLAEYAKTEPGERLNELHSILGSEVADLSPELEQYYGRYFDDRAAIVELSSQYQSVFAELKTRQEALANELNAMANEVERRSSVYRRDLQVLESDIRSFNERAGSGTMTRDEYNQQRRILEARQSELRDEYGSIQQLVSLYERRRMEMTAINSEAEVLNRSINSSLSPIKEGIDG